MLYNGKTNNPKLSTKEFFDLCYENDIQNYNEFYTLKNTNLHVKNKQKCTDILYFDKKNIKIF